MASKEKVTFVRSKEFESIDDELSAALNQLEESNERIVRLLESEPKPVFVEGLMAGGTEDEADSGTESAPE